MQTLINGIPLEVQTYGSKNHPPVVFIHGFPFNSHMWDAQAVLLEKDFFVVTYDQRGHAKSGAGDGQFPLEFLVDDLIGVLDSLNLSKVILCGLSMGGYIALRAIERNPQRVLGLVLCDTRSEADSNEAKLKRAANIKTVKGEGVAAFSEGFLKAVFPSESFTDRKEAVDKTRLMINASPPLGVAGALLALATRTDTTASLPNIHIPTLILVGEKDGITPVAAAESMKTKISGSQMFVIPGAGHLSNMDNPTVFNTHLKTFLARFKA